MATKSSKKSTASSALSSAVSSGSSKSSSSSSSSGYYDANKDYSKELQRTDLTSSERSQLETERQNKINAVYGGVEPNLDGKNYTYSSTQKSSSSGTSSSSGSSSGTSGSSTITGYAPTKTAQEVGSNAGGGVKYSTAYDNPAYLMQRDQGLAGMTVYKNGYNVTYNEDGYATKAVKVKDGVTRAASVDTVYNNYVDRSSYGGSTYDQQYMSNADLADAAYYRAQAESGQISWTDANQMVNSIRAKYGYSGGSDGSQYITTGSGSSTASTSTLSSEYYAQLAAALAQNQQSTSGLSGLLSYDDYLDSSGYSSALSSLQEAQEAYLAQLEAATEQSASTVNDNYDDAARQAYISYMQSRRTLPQRLSASGTNGGLADSQQIALDAELQNNQTTINTERQAALQELQSALTQNQLSAQQSYLSNLSSLQQNAASEYQDYYQTELAREDSNYWKQQETEQALQELETAQTQQEWENAYALLQTLGYTTDEIAAALGLTSGTTTNDADYRTAQLQLALAGY